MNPIATHGKFSPDELAALLRGLTVEAKLARLLQYLQDLQVQRLQLGKRFDFFAAAGRKGERVYYGPSAGPGSPVMPGKNVLVVESSGKVYNMSLKGLKPIDLNRAIPLVDVDLQAGEAILLVE